MRRSLAVCALLVVAGGGGHVEAAGLLREVFVGFSEPDAARYWRISGAGTACADAPRQPPGQNRFCSDQVRFGNGSVTLSGAVAALGAVGSAITLRAAP